MFVEQRWGSWNKALTQQVRNYPGLVKCVTHRGVAYCLRLVRRRRFKLTQATATLTFASTLKHKSTSTHHLCFNDHITMYDFHLPAHIISKSPAFGGRRALIPRPTSQSHGEIRLTSIWKWWAITKHANKLQLKWRDGSPLVLVRATDYFPWFSVYLQHA